MLHLSLALDEPVHAVDFTLTCSMCEWKHITSNPALMTQARALHELIFEHRVSVEANPRRELIDGQGAGA